MNLDEAIERSAAPAAVRVIVDRLVSDRPDVGDRLAKDPALAEAVVTVTAASRSMSRLLETDPDALEGLAALDRREPPPGEPADDERAALVQWKRRELLRIAARDLLGLDRLEITGALLAALADDVFAVASRWTAAEGLTVVGMGKLGGVELNYASDVDVMFVNAGADHSPEEASRYDRAARGVVELARRCFRVDLNLRPEGRSGALTRTVGSYEAYWDRWAQPWEFQALLKARPIAGDQATGKAFMAAAAERLWERPLGAEDLRAVRALKARSEAEVARRGVAERELKRGPGGIRDIEFAVQLLQLVHGPVDEELRSANTLTALHELADAGYVDRQDADRLVDAYRFLRAVEHRLQLVDEQQVYEVPAHAERLDQLARVLRFRGDPKASAAERFENEFKRHRAAVRSIYERIWFRPLLEAFSDTGRAGLLTPEAAAARLAAFGFTDVERTRQAVAELTRGLTRSSRLMQQLLPLLLDWLSSSPDPDLGLLGLRNLTSTPQRSMQLATAFRESPEVARRLCCLLATSRWLGELLQHNPDLIASLGIPAELRLRTWDELVTGAHAAASWRPDMADRRAALKRFTDREGLRIAAHDVLGLVDVSEVGAELTNLAEAALEAAVEVLEPSVPFAVIALGRFGGGELSYASDLDVVFAYEGSTSWEFEAVERTAMALLRFVGGSTPHIYDIDPDLRPEGRSGPLARSLEGFRQYFERWAEPWERLAFVRARPVAGDPDIGRRFLESVEPFVWRKGLTDAERREIRRIKARVERERIPADEDPQFHLKLGRGSLSDVEFCAQLLQLERGVRTPSTLTALDRLNEAGAVSDDERAVLVEAYRYCERTRNRWFLVNSAPGDSLPQQPERLARLARSLGTDPAALRSEYRRVTRRARRVVERLFYGQRP